MEIKQKITVVIGGSSGMGESTVKTLLERGETVQVIGSSQEKLEALEKKYESTQGTLETKQINLYNQEDVMEYISDLEKESRHISHLVNAAGVFKPVPFLDHSENDYDKYMDINKSTFFITQAIARNMKEHSGGSIVNVGSMWAKQAIKATPSSAYSMAKAGLHSLTQHLAMELAEFNIRVNAVSPAVVVTPIYGEFIEKDKIEETLQGFNDFHPIGRVGRPEDISKAIIFLLDDSSSWTTGSILDIDGGVMSGRN